MKECSASAHLWVFRNLDEEDTQYTNSLPLTPLLVSKNWDEKASKLKLRQWIKNDLGEKLKQQQVINISQNTSWEHKNVIYHFCSSDIMKCHFCVLRSKGPHSYTTKYKVYHHLYYKEQIYNSNITYITLPNSWIVKGLVGESAFCSIVSI